MPLKPRTLSVVANPWIYVDHQGRPAGACRHAALKNGGPAGFVGARVDRERTTIISEGTRYAKNILEQGLQDSMQDTVWVFDLEPQIVPDDSNNGPYYRKRILAGELFAADETTARSVGVKFVPVAEALAMAEKAAIAEFDANYGDGAFAGFEKERQEEAKAAAEVKAKADAEAKAAADEAKKAAEAKAPKKTTKGDG